MNQNLTSGHHLLYSTLFPDLYKEVYQAIRLHFSVLQLPCLRPLLDEFAEQTTERLVARPQSGHPRDAFIDLEEVHDRDVERIDAFVIAWRGKIHESDDPEIPRATYPRVFLLARDQILLKENSSPLCITVEDLALITMLLVSVTKVTYRGHDDISEQQAVEKTFSRWFIET